MPNDGYQHHRYRYEPDGTVTKLGSNNKRDWKIIEREVNPRLDGKVIIRENERRGY